MEKFGSLNRALTGLARRTTEIYCCSRVLLRLDSDWITNWVEGGSMNDLAVAGTFLSLCGAEMIDGMTRP